MKTKKTVPIVNVDKLAVLEKQNAELQDKLVRSLADYSNLEKRNENQRQMFIALTTISIISKMIDVLDDLRLTQAHLQDKGLQMSIDKFTGILKSEGLDEINPVNLAFDPANMECIDTCPGKDNAVMSVKKVGYSFNGQVIRPAQVIVGKEKIAN
jgi:molecular chaperone GrpE